ncbi:piggyBac transposable element-derived protein 4-like [Nilaparvata lugens]|uniref:piggyBac transposable element-derived protein 4-like n=1 Tax=Nilaparvata lugens TaxID=108931 RepID=UPI00193C8E35|nr:piggyBac transposable element-derived protein 4-like [Nilaparvata lugens]
MSDNDNEGLSDEQLKRILEDSDFELSELSDFDNSDVDPIYEPDDNASESDISDNETIIPSKLRRVEPIPGPSSRPDPSPGSAQDSDSSHGNEGHNLPIFPQNTGNNVLLHDVSPADELHEFQFEERPEFREQQINQLANQNPTVPQNTGNVVWRDVSPADRLHEFQFEERPGFCEQQLNQLTDHKPIDFFLLFFDNEIQNMLVAETNRYAEQQIIKGICEETISEHSFVAKWSDTNPNELMKFFGLIIWMGLDQKPTLKDYYSNKILYKSEIPKVCGISRNRFEALLHFFHISDNEHCPIGDRLYKISPLVQILNRKFQDICTPSKRVCIDETMVPFRGKLSFRQYIPGKRHKYGVKLFKLCVENGFTYKIKVYGGRSERDPDKPLATSVVMDLMEPLLDSGRTVYTDNFYTSVGLAHELNGRQTHLVGTLRQNRKLNPKSIIIHKLKRGEMKIQRSSTNVVIGKWKDKRDVLFLTTTEIPRMTEVQTKRGIIYKPTTIVDYNKAKGFIDISDQKASYSSPVRRSIKWYRKIAMELLTSTTMVNALVVFQSVTGKNMSITEFRESVVCALLNTDARQAQNPNNEHFLEEKEKRGRCSTCYKKYKEEEGRAAAMKKALRVHTFCPNCPDDLLFMCTKCFFQLHSCKVK